MQDAEILEWAENYLVHRDLVLRRIDKISRSSDKLQIKYKDGSSEQVLAIAKLAQISLKNNSKTTIVTLNTKQNLKKMLELWKSWAQISGLTIIFINPKSKLDTKWIIKPYVHHRICDEKSLKQGLKSMFEMVDEIKV